MSKLESASDWHARQPLATVSTPMCTCARSIVLVVNALCPDLYIPALMKQSVSCVLLHGQRLLALLSIFLHSCIQLSTYYLCYISDQGTQGGKEFPDSLSPVLCQSRLSIASFIQYFYSILKQDKLHPFLLGKPVSEIHLCDG